MSDTFLGELWKHKAREERGEPNPEEKVIGIYLSMKVAAQGDPKLENLLESVNKAILGYESAAFRLTEAKKSADEREEREDIERRMKMRSIAHSLLIDELNILSRNCAEAGRSNMWRQEIGLSRDEVEDWAFGVVDMVRKSTNQK